jgi:hypothetical protein
MKICAFLALIFLLFGSIPQPAASASPRAVLPIEVMGADGTTCEVTVEVADNLRTAATRLFIQAHGLSYEDKGAVQINDSAWAPFRNSTVSVASPASAHGGIGGAFNVVKFTLPLPKGALRSGPNTVRFRFLKTDGFSSGFRILAFNFQTADGEAILPASQFSQEDPTTWRPPLTETEDLNAGQTLWSKATLRQNPLPGASTLVARCADCHARDGRDLKYFNYSNHAIITRAQFHGLSRHQGEQIASWIRSRKTPAPPYARPWNPPYQPGPGLDSRPLSSWAAGAGIEWVLSSDRKTISYLFPKGFSDLSQIDYTQTLNVREIPIALPLPDWNQWLPRYYPGDAWGAEFLDSHIRSKYDGTGKGNSPWNFRQRFAAGAKFTQQIRNDLNHWALDVFNFTVSKTDPPAEKSWSPEYSDKIYSIRLWQLVKTWEMFQEFQLEGEGKAVFGTRWGETRTWPVDFAFKTGPFQMRLPANENGVGGSGLVTNTLSNMWYHLQLVLNASHRQQVQAVPIDWPYNSGKMMDLFYGKTAGTKPTSSRAAGSRRPEIARWLVWAIKGLQVNDNGIPPSNWLKGGWYPLGLHQVIRELGRAKTIDNYWAEFTPSERLQITETVLRLWWKKTKSFSPQQYFEGGYVTAAHHRGGPRLTPDPNELCTGGPHLIDGSFGQCLWVALGQWKKMGIAPDLLNEICDWAQTVWTNPSNNWAHFKR